jgi:hypothetical protein
MILIAPFTVCYWTEPIEVIEFSQNLCLKLKGYLNKMKKIHSHITLFIMTHTNFAQWNSFNSVLGLFLHSFDQKRILHSSHRVLLLLR